MNLRGLGTQRRRDETGNLQPFGSGQPQPTARFSFKRTFAEIPNQTPLPLKFLRWGPNTTSTYGGVIAGLA